MLVKHTRCSDFEEVEHEIPDNQMRLAESIARTSDYAMPVVVSDDGEKLYVLVVLPGGKEKYRVTIESKW